MKPNFILVAAGLLASVLPAFAEELLPYRMKEPFSAGIPHEVASSAIPFDKTYDQFTPEERATLHSFYPGLKPGDEPPFPKRGLKPVMKDIVELQRRGLRLGEARYGVKVDAQGQPRAIAVYKSPDEEFTKAIAYFLINADYKPAKCDGKPCDGEYFFHFNFRLRD